MAEEARWAERDDATPESEGDACRVALEEKSGCESAAKRWSRGVCPNCGYDQADVDSDGILWYPACNYSLKGCYDSGP